MVDLIYGEMDTTWDEIDAIVKRLKKIDKYLMNLAPVLP